MLSRRKFIAGAGFTAGALLAGSPLLAEMAADAAAKKLTILHTNDVHSRLEPFPMDGGKYQGMGGVSARASIIRQIRSECAQVLLLDAGDIFQGTPFFNMYRGEPEIRAMAAMGYDAVTMGNHDFDGGIENFAIQTRDAGFPVLLCNYDFTGTPMEYGYRPYQIFRKGRLKVGVAGVGIELYGLVPDTLYGNTKYLDPVEQLNKVAAQLKREEGCDMVICLSHLGLEYKENPLRICDRILAQETEHVDLIIGGHTHTFMDEPLVLKNKSGAGVIVHQVGWAGIQLGRLDFDFTPLSGKRNAAVQNIPVAKKSAE
jgi:5'-nucleotidase